MAPKPRFDFYGALPDSEVVAPKAESRARLQQAPAAAAEEDASATASVPAAAVEVPTGKTAAVPAAAAREPASTTTAPGGARYLQVGSFRESSRAVELQAKLTALGHKCEVHKVSITGKDVYHRVRVGPFADNDALKQSKRKLDAAGIEAYEVRVEE